MGIATILQTFGSRQFDVISRDDAGRHAAVSGQVLRQGAAQLIVDLVGCCLYRLKTKIACQPAVEKCAGQRTHTSACIQ
jgi:hypothetical protein